MELVQQGIDNVGDWVNDNNLQLLELKQVHIYDKCFENYKQRYPNSKLNLMLSSITVHQNKLLIQASWCHHNKHATGHGQHASAQSQARLINLSQLGCCTVIFILHKLYITLICPHLEYAAPCIYGVLTFLRISSNLKLHKSLPLECAESAGRQIVMIQLFDHYQSQHTNAVLKSEPLV